MDAEIYCGNLYVGGAVTLAASLIDHLPEMFRSGELAWADTWKVVLSSRVAVDVHQMEEVAKFATVEVRDDRPALSRSILRRPVATDARLVFRGPDYAKTIGHVNVAGFADPTVLDGTPPGVDWGARGRAVLELKRPFKRRLLCTYDSYLVQTELMKKRLSAVVGDKPIKVVRNSPSQILRDPSMWTPVELPSRADSELRLFYPARGYPHKNHRAIPAVAEALKELSGRVLRIVTTLRDDELDAMPSGIEHHLINLGELSGRQLGSVYEQCDGVFIPTLNEVSSATPLEGMLFGLPVFASNREFIREAAGDAPFYFDPLDPDAIAECIAGALDDTNAIGQHLNAGRRIVEKLPTPAERAGLFMRALRDAVSAM